MTYISNKTTHHLVNEQLNIQITKLIDRCTKVNSYTLEESLGVGIIDMLSIRTDSYNEKYINRYWNIRKRTRNRYYEDITIYRHKRMKGIANCVDIKICKGDNILFSKKRYHRYLISLNPSKYNNSTELINVLKKVLGKGYKKATIHRVDFSVLLSNNQFPVDFFYHFLSPARKSVSETFHPPEKILEKSDFESYKSSKLTGLSYAVYPNRLSIYDIRTYNLCKNSFKKIEYEKLYKNHKNKLAKNEGNSINVEYQLFDKELASLEITTLDTLQNIVHAKPFASFKMYNPFSLKDGVKLTKRRTKFAIETLMYGYQQARIKNTHTNSNFYLFERDDFNKVKISTEDLEISTFLNRSFKDGMRKYFKVKK